MSISGSKAVVAEFDTFGNGTGDLARLDAPCTPDPVDLHTGRRSSTRDRGDAAVPGRARRHAHPGRWLESIVVADGDLLARFGRRELHWPGGRFRAFELSAGRCERDVALAYRLRAARIAERRAIRDDLAMLQQLGALPG